MHPKLSKTPTLQFSLKLYNNNCSYFPFSKEMHVDIICLFCVSVLNSKNFKDGFVGTSANISVQKNWLFSNL